MPVVSVEGISGAVILSNVDLLLEDNVEKLMSLCMKELDLDDTFEVSLHLRHLDFEDTFDILHAPQLVSDVGLVDGSRIQVIVGDIIGCIRDKELPTYDGSNISQAAAQGAWHDVIRLVEAKADVNITYDSGYTALMHLASMPHGYDENVAFDAVAASQLMKWIILRGAAVSAKNAYGYDALFLWGKYGGSLEQCQVLLDAGADVNGADNPSSMTVLDSVRSYHRPSPPAGQEHMWSEEEPMWKAAESFLVGLGGRGKED